MRVYLTRDMIPGGKYDTLFPNFTDSKETTFLKDVAKKMAAYINESKSTLASIAADSQNRKEDRYAAYLVLGELANLRGEDWDWKKEANAWLANNVDKVEQNMAQWIDDRLDTVNEAFKSDKSDLKEAIEKFKTKGGGVGPVIGGAVSAYAGSLISVYFTDLIDVVPEYLRVSNGYIDIADEVPSYTPQTNTQERPQEQKTETPDKKEPKKKPEDSIGVGTVVATSVAVVAVIGIGLYLRKKAKSL